MLATVQISAGSIYAPVATVTNNVLTNVTSQTLLVNTTFSSANVYAPLGTIDNLVMVASSTGSLDATGITVGTLLATSQISAGSFYAPLATISNVVAVASSTGSLDATGITVSTLLATSQISAGNVYATNSSMGELYSVDFYGQHVYSTIGSFGTLGSGWVSADTITAGNMSLSGDLYVAGTTYSVNITTVNLIDTNFSGGIAYISNMLI